MVSFARLKSGFAWIAKPGALPAAVVCSFALFASPPGGQADFQVDSTLVVLHVTVTDHKGRFIRELPESDFHVFEDGVEQKIAVFRREESPVAVGLVVDNSGSMRRKIPDVVAASDAFARSSNPQDQMFIVNFNENVSLGLPPGEAFVSDPAKLKAAMLEITARGETALYDAVLSALAHIRQSALKKKVLIVVSDGGDNASRHHLQDLLSQLRASNVIVYTVGLFDLYDRDRNPDVLRQIASVSGGESFFPKKIYAVTNVLEAISRDIRNQYTIAYKPLDRNQNGTFRTIRVTLTGPQSDRWVARTRTGYVAGAPDFADSELGKVRQR